MATTLATLRLEVDARRLDKGLAASKKKLIGFQKSAISLRGTMVALAGAAGLAFAAKKVFELGAAVEETASKFRTVFGPAADSVQDFIDDFATMAGLSTEAAQEITATTGAIIQGMGLAQEASAAFAEEVVRVAGDLSSFNNIDIETTSRAIQSAITGEREQVKRLGIVIREEAVVKRALMQTGKELAKQLTEEERGLATLSLITAQAGVAMGDLVRTKDSAANVARRLGARWQNLKEIAASSLLPVFADLLGAIDRQSESTSTLEQRIRSTAVAFQEFIIQMQMAVSTFQVVDAQLALFFAKVDVPLRKLGRFFGMDLPDNVRIAEIALNNLTTAAAEQSERLLLKLNELRAGVLGITTSAAAAAASTTDLALAEIMAADASRAMRFAVVGGSASLKDFEFDAKSAKLALMAYNQAARETEAALLGIASAAGRLAGGGGLGGFLRSAIKIGAAFIPTAGPFIAAGLQGVGFDSGGSIGSGQVGIVGERGPELVRGPANVTGRQDTASMMGGDVIVNIVVEQEGVPVRRITARQRRDEVLGTTHRLALPAPAAV